MKARPIINTSIVFICLFVGISGFALNVLKITDVIESHTLSSTVRAIGVLFPPAGMILGYL